VSASIEELLIGDFFKGFENLAVVGVDALVTHGFVFQGWVVGGKRPDLWAKIANSTNWRNAL